jgi:hypothetical protein
LFQIITSSSFDLDQLQNHPFKSKLHFDLANFKTFTSFDKFAISKTILIFETKLVSETITTVLSFDQPTTTSPESSLDQQASSPLTGFRALINLGPLRITTGFVTSLVWSN